MKFDEKKGVISWISGALAFAFLVFVFFITSVDMRPRVSPDFFFGSDDPGIADTVKISKIFPADDYLIISVGSKDISSSRYLRDISKITQKVSEMDGFSKIISVAAGPKSIAAALGSPFWRPLLINSDQTATLIIGFIKRDASKALVPAVEKIVSSYRNMGSVTRNSLIGNAVYRRKNSKKYCAGC